MLRFYKSKYDLDNLGSVYYAFIQHDKQVFLPKILDIIS